jgi:HSP20 family molecular chaperone IbpA
MLPPSIHTEMTSHPNVNKICTFGLPSSMRICENTDTQNKAENSPLKSMQTQQGRHLIILLGNSWHQNKTTFTSYTQTMAISPIIMERSFAATESWLEGASLSSAHSDDGKENVNNTGNRPYRDLDGSVLREDHTCYLLTLEMPGVQGNDIQVTLHQNTVCISGYRSGGDADFLHPSDRRKRQRISRQFEVDPNSIDLERAVAKVWNGCLTLYAPKKQRRARTVSVGSSSSIDE